MGTSCDDDKSYLNGCVPKYQGDLCFFLNGIIHSFIHHSMYILILFKKLLRYLGQKMFSLKDILALML